MRDPNHLTGTSVAFKTGTSYGYRDGWAIGFDGRHVVGVWVGRADGHPVNAWGGLTGIRAAAPILDDVFSRIGERHRLPAAPPGTLIASAAGLPPAMRHVGRAGEEGSRDRPEIAFPPDRAEIEIAPGAPLTVEVRRGALPLTVLVNGAPVAVDPWRRTIDWVPDGAGQADIVVIDASGAIARSGVFLR